MALTSNSKGSLHPGGNPKSIHGYNATANVEIYRCPAGRMAYLTQVHKGLRINDGYQSAVVQATGSSNYFAPVYVTEGDVVYTLSTSSNFFGIEFDI